jgi:hypothetical protein
MLSMLWSTFMFLFFDFAPIYFYLVAITRPIIRYLIVIFFKNMS